MNDRNLDQLLDTWLNAGPTVAPNRVTEAARLEIRSTRQSAVVRWWPLRRFPSMNSIMCIALATTVVAVAALLGFNYLVAPNIGGPGLGDPTPTPIPSPRPLTQAGEPVPIEPGTYVAGDPFSVRVTFTVPAGWQSYVGGPYRVDLGWVDKSGGIDFHIFDLVAADPCHLLDVGYLNPPPGPSADDLATALANLPGIEVTDLADVTVDGYSGTQLTITAPDSFAGCNLPRDGYVIWQLPLGIKHVMTPGERDRVWILDVEGERLVIVIPERSGYTAEQRAEVQAIFDSIQLEGR